MSRFQLTVVLCISEIAGMAGFATFPVLVPTFLLEWGLTNTGAGWICGVYYAGYLLGVPVLVSLTDRIDPRRILLLGTVVAGLSALGFGLFAGGFWTALVFRFLGGIGLAGTYMPGLKVLSDRTEGPLQSRYVALYTACFSIGASASYFVSGEIAAFLGWQWAFGLSSVGSLAAGILIAVGVPPSRPHLLETNTRRLLDFRPVLAARPAMAYIIAYGAHVWELFSMRSWIVTFLAFSQSLQPSGASIWSITQLAAIINLLGLPASLAGNEFAVRFDRRRVISAIMTVSVIGSGLVGFAAPCSATVVIGLCLFYGITVMADSAALTAGAVAAAPIGFRGATLAVHSAVGFGAGFLGPLAVGTVLDFLKGTELAWGAAFVTMGLGAAVGPVVLLLFGRGRDTSPSSLCDPLSPYDA